MVSPAADQASVFRIFVSIEASKESLADPLTSSAAGRVALAVMTAIVVQTYVLLPASAWQMGRVSAYPTNKIISFQIKSAALKMDPSRRKHACLQLCNVWPWTLRVYRMSSVALNFAGLMGRVFQDDRAWNSSF
jgi:hypothetical protein